MREIVLTGLDGANPLAYMSALGALRVITESAMIEARLSWRDQGRWRPVLHLPKSAPDILDSMVADLRTWENAPELQLEYAKDGKDGKKVRDLKPPPTDFRRLAERAAGGRPDQRRLADFVAAYATDVVRDNNGNTKPTALHFTAGQQNFLDMVLQLSESVTREHFQEALFGPWRYESELPVLRWDVSGERLYALMASNPAGKKARGVPGADWLAFLSLPLFPSFPAATSGGKARILTTGFEGKGKYFTFRWPIWGPCLALDSVRSLVACSNHLLSAAERRARGIELLLESEVRRSDHGYGTFSAPEPVMSAQ